MNIVLPNSFQVLKNELQQCAVLAQAQGFCTQSMNISVDNSALVFRVQTPTNTVSIGCLLSLEAFQIRDTGVDYQLTYFDKTSTEQEWFENEITIDTLQVSQQQIDMWWFRDQQGSLERRRLSSSTTKFEPYRHLAWVLTALGLDFPIEDALVLARAALNVSRETWPSQCQDFPVVMPPAKEGSTDKETALYLAAPFSRVQPELLSLYPVVNSVEWVERCLKLGIKTLQLRIKDPKHPNLEADIIAAIKLGQAYQAQLFINDHWQLALKHGAYGVHLGQEDLVDANLAELKENNIRVGLSTHSYYELLRISHLYPSYIALGHIFPTTTKQMPSKPQGLVRLGLYQQLIDSMAINRQQHQYIATPTVAIGGIDLKTAHDVWQCGVTSLAVVRAITQAKDPRYVVSEFHRLMSVSRETPQVCEREAQC